MSENNGNVGTLGPRRGDVRTKTGAVCLALALLLATAMPARSAPPDEDHRRTIGLVAVYRNAPNWVVKSIILLSLGDRWHPDGTAIVLDAFRSKDRRLKAFAAEALLSTPGPVLRTVLSAELLDELILKQMKEKNKVYVSLIGSGLSNAFPETAAKRVPWSKWWKRARARYAPEPWVEKPSAKDTEERNRTVASKSVVTRALELSQAGIELVLCFDSTGSMQPTIDAARAAMIQVVAILEGLSPDLRVGVVHYKDFQDLGGKGDAKGAEVRTKLTSKLRTLPRTLEKLRAGGGGDFPESVYAGLWLSLHRSMGWSLTASKMVVLIGDAPPHEINFASTLDIVRTAREETAWKLDRKWKRGKSKPTVTDTGKKSGQPPIRVNPILTSTLCTGMGRVHPLTESRFRKIAEAGGGAYARLTAEDGSATSAAIVKHLVELTFGPDYRDAAERLAEAYLFWKRNGFLK